MKADFDVIALDTARISVCNYTKAGYTRIVCKKSRKVPRIMQDEDASPPQSPPNRWMAARIAVSPAQALSAFGITPVYPFLPLYAQTLDGAQFANPKLPAGLVIAAPTFWGRLADQCERKKMALRAMFDASAILLLRMRFCFACSSVRLSVYG